MSIPIHRHRPRAQKQQLSDVVRDAHTPESFLAEHYRRSVSVLAIQIVTVLQQASMLYQIDQLDRIPWGNPTQIDIPYHHALTATDVQALQDALAPGRVDLSIRPRSNTSLTLRWTVRSA